MKRGINIENIVLSLKIPIKLVINKAGELNAFIDSGEREGEEEWERIAYLHIPWRETISLHLAPIEVARLAKHMWKKID